MSLKSLAEEVETKSKAFKEELNARDEKIHTDMQEMHKNIKEEYKDDLKTHMREITLLHEATNKTIETMSKQLGQLYAHALGKAK